MNLVFQIGIFGINSDRCEQIQDTVFNYITNQKLPCLIKVYTSFADARGLYLDEILKTDICMIDFSDAKAAVKLVAQLCEKRKDLTWICVGANLQMLMDLLLLRPSGYIPDIRNTDYMRRLLGRLIQYLQQKEQADFFAFKCEGAFIKIPYAHISYFESSAKKVTLHLYNSSKRYYITAKLDDIQSIAPPVFLRCHQSCLVNMNAIRYFDSAGKRIIALPDEEVPISRRMLVASRERYEAYIRGKQENKLNLPIMP